MTEVVKTHDAKTHFSALLARVEAGEEFILARGDVEVAKLVPLVAKGKRRLGFLDYKLPDSFFDELDDMDADQWG